MKKIYLITAILLLFSCKNNAEQKEIKEISVTEFDEPIFDSIKAQKYGADEYGMKQYVIAFLKKGPNRDLDSTSAYDLQMAHLKNIGKMADAGHLVLAGPFMNDGDLRGIYVFNVKTVEEAQALTETDPAIKAGSLVMELLPWYGSAALMGINEGHKRVAKTLF